MNFYIFNDRASQNEVYRKVLIQYLSRCGFNVVSIGLFDSFVSFLKFILIASFRGRNSLTSNIKVNLLFLVFVRSRGAIILNGMGRYKNNRVVRKSICILLKINKRKRIIVQNYLDYRYIRLHFRRDVFWIPGSGALSRPIGKKNEYVVISRRNKIHLQLESFREAVESLPKLMVNIVGLDQSDFPERNYHDQVKCRGRVAQNDIFAHGNAYIQLHGYGEGLPHALTEAIFNDLRVYISKQDFRNYGLGKLDYSWQHLEKNWGVCEPKSLGGKHNLEASKIAIDICHLLGFQLYNDVQKQP